MPEDVAAALKAQGLLCLDGPHAPAGPLAAVEMVTLGFAGVHALGRGTTVRRRPCARRTAMAYRIDCRLNGKKASENSLLTVQIAGSVSLSQSRILRERGQRRSDRRNGAVNGEVAEGAFGQTGAASVAYFDSDIAA